MSFQRKAKEESLGEKSQGKAVREVGRESGGNSDSEPRRRGFQGRTQSWESQQPCNLILPSLHAGHDREQVP